MAACRTQPIIQHVRRVVLRRDAALMRDGQLLEHFITRQDPAAFDAPVLRHSTMVWGVRFGVTKATAEETEKKHLPLPRFRYPTISTYFDA